jgi:NTP pyrophosphatase (non-canonical NTP hydrolase)
VEPAFTISGSGRPTDLERAFCSVPGAGTSRDRLWSPTTGCPRNASTPGTRFGRTGIGRRIDVAKRHQNRWLQAFPEDMDRLVQMAIRNGVVRNNGFNSPHELYAVLFEEVEEFWESVRNNDPDPGELLQVAAVAIAGVMQICDEAREEMNERLQKAGETSHWKVIGIFNRTTPVGVCGHPACMGERECRFPNTGSGGA